MTFLTTAQVKTATAAVPLSPTRSIDAYRKYHATISALEARWGNWLAAEYAADLPPAIHDKLYGKAWANGHSSDYAAVENYYEEHAIFAREVIAAFAEENS